MATFIKQLTFSNGRATAATAANPTEADLSTSDVTTLNVSSTKHGFAPKSPADATQFLNGAATPAFAQVKDSDLSTSDITTNNVSTTKHGFAPKAPNDATKYLDGTGAYSVPAGTGTVTSVALTVPAEFSVSGSPVTTSGTLAVSKANQNANLVYAGPSSGAAAAPTFRALVAADVNSVASMWTGYIYGFPLTWSSTTAVIVGFPNANAPTSLCRDAADAAFISVAGGTTYTINTGTNGAVLGDDSFQGAGTVAWGASGNTITGTGTAFKTAFGTRSLTGTSSATASTTLTGTGTKYLTEVAVNDLVGNATGGWSLVTAIASDTSLTLAQPLTVSGACTLIEQPTIDLGALDTATGGHIHQVMKITSDTSLLLTEVTNGGAQSGQSYWIGRHYLRATALAGVQYGCIHVVSGGSGTSAVISTQRTKTFAQSFGGSSGITGYSTSYRRIGAVPFDSSGNLVPLVPDLTQLGNHRHYVFAVTIATNNTRIVSNFTTTGWNTQTGAQLCVPPTAFFLDMLLTNTASSGGNFQCFPGGGVAPTGTPGSNQSQFVVSANSGSASQVEGFTVDAQQRFSCGCSSAPTGGGGYVDVLGYHENV